MSEGSEKFIKCALFVSTACLVICGIMSIVAGVWTLFDRSFVETFLNADMYFTSADILITLGVIVTIIAGLGCVGAMKESKCMLLTFFIILFCIILGMLVATILVYVFKNKLQIDMHELMENSIPEYGNNTRLTEKWDFMQEHLKCCGLVTPEYQDSYEVWKKNEQFQGDKQVPNSCCKAKDEKGIKLCQSDPKKNTYNEDCFIQMKDYIKDHALLLGGIGIGICCILVVGMVVSIALYLKINYRQKRPQQRQARY